MPGDTYWAESVDSLVLGRSIIELKTIDEQAKKYLKAASSYSKAFPDFNEVREKLEDAHRTIVTSVNTLKNKVGDILGATFSSPYEASQLLAEISKLIPKFEDDESGDSKNNIRDMKEMQSIASSCLENYERINSFRGSKKAFFAHVNQIIEETCEAIQNAELEWDAESIFSTFAKQLAEQRDADFNTWLNNLNETAENLPTMNVTEAESLKKQVLEVPEWGSEEFSQDVDALLKSIDSRLGEMEMDWIISRFSSLNDIMRKELIQRMLNIMGK